MGGFKAKLPTLLLLLSVLVSSAVSLRVLGDDLINDCRCVPFIGCWCDQLEGSRRGDGEEIDNPRSRDPQYQYQHCQRQCKRQPRQQQRQCEERCEERLEHQERRGDEEFEYKSDPKREVHECLRQCERQEQAGRHQQQCKQECEERIEREQERRGDGMRGDLEEDKKYEQCQRMCEREGRGQGEQWQCQKRCQEKYQPRPQHHHHHHHHGESETGSERSVEEMKRCRHSCEEQGYDYDCEKRCRKHFDRGGARDLASSMLTGIADIFA